MSARDQILSQLKRNEQPAEHPGPWRSRRNFADLAERFTDTLNAGKGEVFRAASYEEALDQIDTILHELQAKRVVVNDTAPLEGMDVKERWPDFEWFTAGKSEGDIKSFCADADVGLSGADAALAETGSVIISSGPGKSRLATLLPPVHLAIVPTSILTSDILTWTAARQGKPGANMVLVSGPSKTADIEQVLAIGVHGPKRFIVVLYDD
ncbi:MAG: lactate utilization protein [Anaerolineae bacterium]|nr:lactate utilization protein [Anaerolineae bacterium]